MWTFRQSGEMGYFILSLCVWLYWDILLRTRYGSNEIFGKKCKGQDFPSSSPDVLAWCNVSVFINKTASFCNWRNADTRNMRVSEWPLSFVETYVNNLLGAFNLLISCFNLLDYQLLPTYNRSIPMTRFQAPKDKCRMIMSMNTRYVKLN